MTYPERNQLNDWIDELGRIDQDVQLRLEPLSEAQFVWRPGEGRWSVGECLEHLVVTTGLMLGRVRPALERARAEGVKGNPPFKYGWLGGWFVRAMEPGQRGMTAPKNFAPPSGTPKSAVLGRFAAVQEDFRETLESAPGVALDKVKAPSTAQGAGWLRLNLAAWLAATLAHERRHVAQAIQVTRTSGFPA
jgi:hypothetical protein